MSVGRVQLFWLLALTACILIAFSNGRALAQFSNKDGSAPDGSYRVQVELTPYLWLPALDGTIGLNRPPGTDVSINRARPTVADLVNTLNGAFVGDGLVRYGPWSAELDVDWVSATQKKTFPALVDAPEVELKTTDSVLLVSPGFGYRVIPDFAPDTVSLDFRAGFTYFNTSASAAFAQSRLGGASITYDFFSPWLGIRADYFPSPRWRIDLTTAVTGLGADSAWGWNTKLGVSYLITHWFDATLGYAATGMNRNLSAGLDGSSRAVHLVAYGPVLAIGFRF